MVDVFQVVENCIDDIMPLLKVIVLLGKLVEKFIIFAEGSHEEDGSLHA